MSNPIQHGIFLIIGTLVFASEALADEPLSAAELEALAAAAAAQTIDDTQRQIDLCHHLLLSGLEEQKADLLAKLGNQTCSEAIAAAQQSGQ